MWSTCIGIKFRDYTVTNGHLLFNKPKLMSVEKPITPKMNYTSTNIPFRNKTLYEKKGYNDRRIVVTLGLFGNPKIVRLMKNELLEHWIGARGLLYLLDEPDKYYEAELLDPVEEEDTKRGKELTFTFTCSPFLYGQFVEIPLLGSGAITYRGTVATHPIIKLVGTGTVTITCGENSFTYTGMNNETVWINGEDFIVHNEDYHNKMESFTGDFIGLNPGNNPITISKTGTMTVSMNYREHYLY